MKPKMKLKYTVTRQLFTIAVLIVAMSGCQNEEAQSVSNLKTDFSDPAITDFHNLGWIGAMTHPLNDPLSFADPNNEEKTCSPGGLVVRDVFAGSPADEAGLLSGDVIVGIADEWVPIKDDPTLDFIKQVELRVAAGEATSELKVFRNGKCQTISLNNISNSLDEGLPAGVVRFSEAATRGLTHLAGLQNKDGSFGDEKSAPEIQLQDTALAGLAFLSSGDEKFTANVKECKSYIAAEIDRLIKDAISKELPDTSDDDSKPGVVKMPSVELDPLTAAYLLQFFAESNISMIDQKWMPRLFGVLGSLGTSQSEAGGWGESVIAEDVPLDVAATHTTNQVLLAVGMLERNGVMGDPEMISKSCGFLKNQKAARANSVIDRRTKASLTAGTAVALVAINCQTTDADFKEAVVDGLDKLSERPGDPEFALPGILSAAILAKASGSDQWTQFHGQTKYWLSSLQLPEGSFKTMPGCKSINPVQDAAHYCLLLSMQSTNLKNMVGEKKSQMMLTRNSAGETVEGAASSASAAIPGEMPPGGAQVINLDLGDLEGGDIEEAIRKKLEEQGIDIGDAEIKGLGGAPPSPKKKDD